MISIEASYFDRFNMTKNGLEYDRIKFTPSNMIVRTWPEGFFLGILQDLISKVIF